MIYFFDFDGALLSYQFTSIPNVIHLVSIFLFQIHFKYYANKFKPIRTLLYSILICISCILETSARILFVIKLDYNHSVSVTYINDIIETTSHPH